MLSADGGVDGDIDIICSLLLLHKSLPYQYGGTYLQLHLHTMIRKEHKKLVYVW